MANYYDTLGIAKDADEKEIRSAFRKQARKYHPDLNPNDKDAEARFKEINEAYEVLSNADNRKKYDAYGDQWKHADQIEAQRRRSRSPFDFGDTGGVRIDDTTIFSGIEDILGDLGHFGNFRTRTQAPSSVRTEAPVSVSLEDAYRGTTVNANLSVGGSMRRFEVKIPPGVDNGSTVRVTPERGTELLFRVTVTPSVRFKRLEDDLYVEARVPFEVVMLGGETEVQTIDGRRISVKIPENSQNGQNIRLRGQGMPKLGKPDEKGDLYVTIRPVMPKELNEEEKELIIQFRKLRAGER